MTHVKVLQAGHSSQGTSEPITPELEQTGMCRKRCFYSCLLGQGHLAIFASQVQGREPLFTGQHIQGIINSWQRLGVLHSNIVEAALVDTKPGTIILYRY